MFRCRDKILNLDQPIIMGILNITPDSFFDGGRYSSLSSALAQAEKMLEEGAQIIDIGGESTRPGAARVSADEQILRIMHIIEAIAKKGDVVISVDTSDPAVMRCAADCGAKMINDVSALSAPGARQVVSEYGLGVCLMHMQGMPINMQQHPSYDHLLDDISLFLREKITACIQEGILHDQIVIDPGIGFGKTVQHNLIIINQLKKMLELDCPLLVGASRKSFIGHVLKKELDQRLFGGLAAHVVSVMHGARIIRTHDVKETQEAVNMAWAILASTSFSNLEIK